MTQPAEKTYNVTVWFKSFTYADNCIADIKQVALDALAGREFKEP